MQSGKAWNRNFYGLVSYNQFAKFIKTNKFNVMQPKPKKEPLQVNILQVVRIEMTYSSRFFLSLRDL